MKILGITFLVFLNCFSFFSQKDLNEKEAELNVKLLALRSAKTDEEIDDLNANFRKAMEAFLKNEDAFNHKFTQLKTVAIIDSPDGKIRIVNWNLEYTDMTYRYCAFVMRKDENKDKIITTELVDNLDAYEPKPEVVIDSKNWYGALYYKMIPFERNNKMEYILLGWDGGTPGSNFKLIDVLSFTGNNLKLGSPVFKVKKSTLKRVIFEYSDKSNMTVKFEEKYGRIVFDHLSPESPSLAGVYSYYVPDMSYDSYNYSEGVWVLNEDVIAVNPEEDKDKKYFYALNDKTGKPEKVPLKKEWIDPTDINKAEDIKHVARTPESEAALAASMMEDPVIEKVKRNRRDRRKPENMSVTTGKYKSKRTKKLD
jgi:hypothetical protein